MQGACSCEADDMAVSRVREGKDLGTGTPEELRCVSAEAAPLPQSRTIFTAPKAGADSGKQKLDVGLRIPVFFQRRAVGGRLGAGQNAENLFFDFVLFVIRQLIARMGENLDAVIGERIVGGRNHDPGGKITSARKVRDSRSGDDAGEAHTYTGPCEAMCQAGCDGRPRFPGIHADQHWFRGCAAPDKVVTERDTESGHGCRVEGAELPATPRIPSVPKSCFAMYKGTVQRWRKT